MLTITIEVDKIMIDKDGEKIEDPGEVARVLEGLWKAAQTLYRTQVDIAKLEGTRLESLSNLDVITKKQQEPPKP